MALKILLCEDYHRFADAACEALEAAGHPVTQLATNGDAALAALDPDKYTWDAVVTDYDLNYGPNGGVIAQTALDLGVGLAALWSSVTRLESELPPGLPGRDGFLLLRKDELAALTERLDMLEKK
jgi:CheY-like chemotaxis protein